MLNIIYQLSDLENDLKWSSQKTIMFQTGVIKACREETYSNSGGSAIEKRLTELENKLANLKFGQDTTIGMQQIARGETSVERPVGAEEKREKKNPTNINKTTEAWKRVVDGLKRNGKIRLYTALLNTRINELNDLIWEIEFPNGLTDFNKNILEMLENTNELRKEIYKITGKEIHLKFKDGKNMQKATNSGGAPKSPIRDLGIDINIIE